MRIGKWKWSERTNPGLDSNRTLSSFPPRGPLLRDKPEGPFCLQVTRPGNTHRHGSGSGLSQKSYRPALLETPLVAFFPAICTQVGYTAQQSLE